MSSAAIITIAVVAIVVLAAIVLVTAARRADVRGAGALSRETRRRDKDADIDLPPVQTGRVRRAGGQRQRAVSSQWWRAAVVPTDRTRWCGFHPTRTPSASAVASSSTGRPSR